MCPDFFKRRNYCLPDKVAEQLNKVFQKLKMLREIGFMEALDVLAERINFPRQGFPRFGVNRFMQKIASQLPPDALILDAGAGSKPYAELFAGMRYHSCDHPGASDRQKLLLSPV